MNTPVLIINLKAYKDSSGENAIRVALLAEKAGKETGKSVAVAVQAIDLRSVVSKVSIPVFVQHVDHVGYGSHTGHLAAEVVKEAGAAGTLINHSEFKLPEVVVQETIRRCKSSGLISVVCAGSKEEAVKLSRYRPSFIAIEPPELIGGSVSVSDAKPELISETVMEVRSASKVPVICGAGVHKTEDVSKALMLGAQGVLVASGIIKADNPYKEILELLKGLT